METGGGQARPSLLIARPAFRGLCTAGASDGRRSRLAWCTEIFTNGLGRFARERRSGGRDAIARIDRHDVKREHIVRDDSIRVVKEEIRIRRVDARGDDKS